MKTLKNHTLIYDADCPLCVGYTSAFKKLNMLDENGRIPFSKVAKESNSNLDINRSKNEIALINRNTNAVIYGIDSLLLIIGTSFPIIKRIGNTQPLYWLLQKLYKFISFNGKVIITAPDSNTSCIPDYNIKYRWLYIMFCVIISSVVLNLFSKSLTPFITKSSLMRELIMCSGQLIW